MRIAALVVSLAWSASLLAGAPRITFVRTLPAPHDLGEARNVALLYSIGDNDKVSAFVDVFLEQVNRGELHVSDATDQHFIGDHADEATVRRVRREHPANLFLGIREFTCSTTPHSGEGSVYDFDGKRVKRTQSWLDAVCRARIDIISGQLRRQVSFQVKGEGTSPRVERLTDEERDVAVLQAARFAAVQAAEAITPRQVRESIELDDTAPSFEEAYAMIDAARLDQARAIWEAALRKHRDSAALHYDLAAVCEAAGDVDAARRYYLEARRLSPAELRYKAALETFRRRTKP